MTNPTNKYVTPVGLQQPAAADLSDGTTGTGAVVLAGSPTLTGAPIAPTATTGDSTTKIATTAFVTTAITNAVAGINPAVAVQAATAAILPNSPTYLNGVSGVGATITAGATNVALVVDGYTPILNDRILVKNESGGGGLGAGKNGIYFVSQLAGLALAWVLTRALDYDQPSDINNTGAIPVINGTVNTTTQWVLSSSITAVDGTQALTYTQFSVNPSTLAPLNSPAFTGVPTAPTAAVADSSTTIATTAFVAANASTIDTLKVNGTSVVSPFTLDALVNGVGPVGEVKANGNLVQSNMPCMVEVPNNLADGQRAVNTVYQNTTGFPILVCVYAFSNNGTANATFTAVSDTSPSPTALVWQGTSPNSTFGGINMVFFVLPGNYYKVSTAVASPALGFWREYVCPVGAFSDSGDVVGSRTLGTVVQNNSANTMFVCVQVTGVTTSNLVQGISDSSPSPVNVVDSSSQTSTGSGNVTVFFIVPPHHYYKVTAASGSKSHWHEYTWGIGCVKSQDLALTTGKGHIRTMGALSIVLSSAANSAVTVVSTPSYINSNPPRQIRWVQIVDQSTAASNTVQAASDEAIPPQLQISQTFHTTLSVAKTSRFPVMPSQVYSCYELSTGTITTSHWWEYQLG